MAVIAALVGVCVPIATAVVQAGPAGALPAGVAPLGAGGEHSCALTATSTVKCWGVNSGGQLGDGTVLQRSAPVAVPGLAGVTALALGGDHTCAITAAGAVRCWGINDNGQLGNATQSSSGTPVAVAGLGSGVKAISAGAQHTCAITSAGAVQCWGANGNGQLGNGGASSLSTIPVQVSGLTSGVVAISAGEYFTCAITAAGAVRCWGSNSLGQLGNGQAPDSPVPVAVTGLSSGTTALAAGGYHACAASASALACWGNDSNGQLGDGGSINQRTPVAVQGITTGVTNLAAGRFHSCAVLASATVKCWGYGLEGELGNGGTQSAPIPVTVVALSGTIAAISSGTFHTCVLTVAGTVSCWGYDVHGQLGAGTTANAPVPLQVIGGATFYGAPFLKPGTASVTEGDTGTVVVNVPITLSTAASSTVTVHFATTDTGAAGIATAGADYVATSGDLTFAPGETSKSVPLTVKGDVIDEPPALVGEWILVAFSNAVGAPLDTSFFGLGVGIIVDDDPTPVIKPGIGSVVEGNTGTTTVSVPITLSNPSASPISVDFTTVDTGVPGIATAGLDYVARSGTISIPPGATNAIVAITVNGDTIKEPPLLYGEWILVVFSNASNATVDSSFFGIGIGIITDDD